VIHSRMLTQTIFLTKKFDPSGVSETLCAVRSRSRTPKLSKIKVTRNLMERSDSIQRMDFLTRSWPMNQMDYDNKWILITGASSGIGGVYAEEFAKKKANLILVARNKDKLERAGKSFRDKYSIEVVVKPYDLSKADSAHQLFEEIKSSNISVYGLINNAGFGTFGNFHETSLKKIEEMLMLNNYTLTSLTHLFLSELVKERKGFIVNIASLAAYMPFPYMAAYAASKSYVLSFTTALWAEYRSSGVRILTVSPGATDTGFFDAVGSQELRKASGNNLDRAEDVVRDTFKALEGSHAIVVAGSSKNLIMSKIASLTPRETAASLFAKSQRKAEPNER
jgi:uncharacterized protein